MEVLNKSRKIYLLIVPLVYLSSCFLLKFYYCSFPLNDDWAYLIPVKNFIEQNKLVLTDWASSTQLTHIFGGIVFSKLFSFHLGWIKIVNVFYFALFLIVFQKILEEFEIKKGIIIISAFTLAFSPINFLLSMTFMTDITYLFWQTLTIYFFVKYIKEVKNLYFYLALFSSGFAFLTRQLGIVLPIAFIIFLIWQRKLNFKILIKTIVLFIIFPVAYFLWFQYIHGPTWASENYVFRATIGHLLKFDKFIYDFFDRFLATIIEAGFLLFPLGLTTILSFRKKIISPEGKKIRINISWFIITIVTTLMYMFFKGYLPYLENNLGKTGIGAMTVGNSEAKYTFFFSENWFWVFATFISVFSAASLFSSISFKHLKQRKIYEFFFLVFLLHFLVSVMGAKYFDRYIVNFLPFLALSLSLMLEKFNFKFFFFFFLFIIFSFITYLGVADYFEWNKAKWELAEKVAKKWSISPERIANGFDYNAWFNYEKNMKYLKSFKNLKQINEWEWQQIMDYQVIFSYHPLDKSEILDSINYRLPVIGENTIYALKVK